MPLSEFPPTPPSPSPPPCLEWVSNHSCEVGLVPQPTHVLGGGGRWLGRSVEVRLFVSPSPLLPYGAPLAPQEDRVWVNQTPSSLSESFSPPPSPPCARGVRGFRK